MSLYLRMDLKVNSSGASSFTSSNLEINAKPNENEEQHLSEINEIDLDFIKIEPKEEDQSEEEAEVTEEETDTKCHTVRHHCQAPKVTLMRPISNDLAVVSNLYSLLEDFMRMAHLSESLLCCQPAGSPQILMCDLCGKYFVGKADRLLKLCKHYESEHPSDALNLILDATERYSKLIGHMRRALEFDEWFGSIRYDGNRGTKGFYCKKCKDCC